MLFILSAVATIALVICSSSSLARHHKTRTSRQPPSSSLATAGRRCGQQQQRHKKLLYRKLNRNANNVIREEGTYGEFKWDRKTKRTLKNESLRQKMHGPLYQFLLSKVGTTADWDDVYSEAKRRLKGGGGRQHDHAIFDIVLLRDDMNDDVYMRATSNTYKESMVRIGDYSYYSLLYVHPNTNRLTKLDPDLIGFRWVWSQTSSRGLPIGFPRLKCNTPENYSFKVICLQGTDVLAGRRWCEPAESVPSHLSLGSRHPW